MIMSTRKKAAVAGASAALVLVGGSLALWSDTADVTAKQADTGHLAVAIDDADAFDVSLTQRPTVPGSEQAAYEWEVTDGSATLIDPYDEFVFVPEDAVLFAAPIQVALKGTNMLAALDVEMDSQLAAAGFAVDVLGIVIADSAAEAVGADPADYLGTDSAYFTPETIDDVWAVWQVEFDDDCEHGLDLDQDSEPICALMDYTVADVLQGTAASLVQVRDDLP